MNIWNEPYPDSLADLVKKCEDVFQKIESEINDPVCSKLDDFYQIKGLRTYKNSDTIKKYTHNFNSKLNSKKLNEIKGLYVFGEENNKIIKPVYIGISGTIFRRIKQHTRGKLHNEATLAYLQAKHSIDHKSGRVNLAPEAITSKQIEIRKYRIVIIPETNDFDLYFMEVYLSGKFKTKWNSFRTH